MDDQPFTITENKDFRNLVKILNPDALVPKADTIKNDIMDNFKEEQEKRKVLLNEFNHFCFK